MLSSSLIALTSLLFLSSSSFAQIVQDEYVSLPGVSGIIATVNIGSYDGDESLYLTTPVGLVSSPGPMVYDRNGSLVWIGSADFGMSFDLRMQEYDGQTVLTVFNGTLTDSHGEGTCWVMDDTYTVIAEVNSIGGGGADLHECRIPTDTNSTIMITVYIDIEGFDLSSFLLGTNGTLIDCWFQEIDIATGNVLFNWSIHDHISPFDSYATPGEGVSGLTTWDAYHVNSVDKSADGNYLISSRHLKQLIYIDKDDGSIIWQMGGKNGNFTIGDGAQFNWQHHATFNPDDNSFISLFDDGASNWEIDELDAHGLYLSYETTGWTVTEEQSFYPSPYSGPSTSQGSMQRFADGTAVVGFGSNPWIVEYASDGTVTFSMSLAIGFVENSLWENYRAFKVNFTGNPTYPPALALLLDTAYFSWNGKTAVRSWDVLSGSDVGNLTTRKSVDRSGFETHSSLLGIDEPLVAVVALDKAGQQLGQSDVLFVANGSVAQSGSVNN